MVTGRSRKWRGVRDSLGELEGRLELSGEVDEINGFCTNAGGNPDAVVDIAEGWCQGEIGTRIVQHNQQEAGIFGAV